MRLVKALFFLLLVTATFQNVEGVCCWNDFLPNRYEIGPEIYHIERSKEGGSNQSGWMYGGRIRIQHLSPCHLYWGFDAFRASGKTSGHSGSGKKIRSKFRDGQLEGRLGYTFHFSFCKPLLFTPYVGYGSFYGRNYFIHPSSVRCHFHNRFQFASTGFLSTYEITPCVSVGVNFKTKFMQNGISKITKDPRHDGITLGMQDEWQYEVDLPICYRSCCDERIVEGTLEPFYRFRHYGGLPNYPFDFYDTKFQIYGIRFLLRLFF